MSDVVKRSELTSAWTIALSMDSNVEIGTETKLEIRGLRILVADDHPAIRELLTELLEAEGALVGRLQVGWKLGRS